MRKSFFPSTYRYSSIFILRHNPRIDLSTEARWIKIYWNYTKKFSLRFKNPRKCGAEGEEKVVCFDPISCSVVNLVSIAFENTLNLTICIAEFTLLICMSEFIKFFKQVNCFYISSIPMGHCMHRWIELKNVSFNLSFCNVFPWLKRFSGILYLRMLRMFVFIFWEHFFHKQGSFESFYIKVDVHIVTNHMEWGGKSRYWNNGCKVNVPS